MTVESAGASPKPKQGRIDGYFSSSKRTPTKTSGKKVQEEAVKTVAPVDLQEALNAVKSNEPKLVNVEEKTKIKQDRIVEAVVSKLKPTERETLLGKRRSVKSEDEPVAPIQVAAWEKFDDLVTPVTKLRLPEKFTLLQRIHSALDGICQLSADRDQPAIFHRIKKAAENIIGREITLDHLKQLVEINPDLYIIRPTHIIHQGRRTASYALAFNEKLSQADLIDRREKLHSSLLDKVMEHHREFLKSIDVEIPDGAKLKSWHPKYDLESVPDLPMTEFEQSASFPSNKSTPSQIKEVLPPTSSKPTPSAAEIVDKVKSTDKKPSLLERIKMKQKNNEINQMVGNAEGSSSKELEVQQLQELADNLSFLFGTAQKSALPLGDITSKISLGSKTALSSTDIISRIKRLEEVIPSWLQFVTSGSTQVVRIDRSFTMKSVKDSIFQFFKA